MKKFINKAMLTLVVFGLAIVSSFAMETDPPTEPVKTTVETEVVEEVQPTVINYGYYDSVLDECVLIPGGSPGADCLTTNSGLICVDDLDRELYQMHFDEDTNTWICGLPLNKSKVN